MTPNPKTAAREYIEKRASIVGNYDDDTLREAVEFGYAQGQKDLIEAAEKEEWEDAPGISIERLKKLASSEGK